MGEDLHTLANQLERTYPAVRHDTHASGETVIQFVTLKAVCVALRSAADHLEAVARERDSLRLELQATESNRIAGNKYLIDRAERAEAALALAVEVLEYARLQHGHHRVRKEIEPVLESIRTSVPVVEALREAVHRSAALVSLLNDLDNDHLEWDDAQPELEDVESALTRLKELGWG